MQQVPPGVRFREVREFCNSNRWGGLLSDRFGCRLSVFRRHSCCGAGDNCDGMCIVGVASAVGTAKPVLRIYCDWHVHMGENGKHVNRVLHPRDFDRTQICHFHGVPARRPTVTKHLYCIELHSCSAACAMTGGVQNTSRHKSTVCQT